jgi:glycosyltransferase involved in cell wall biosynthesis
MSGDGDVRIALDARPLTTSRAGVATYCRGLVYGLASEARHEQILLYAKDALPAGLPLAPPLRWQTMPAPLWLPAAVPRALRSGRVDLFHGTNHMAPPLASVPTVITVHDLSALTMPRHHTWRNRLLTVPQMLLSLHRARRLIADSRYTAGELAHVPGIDPERIRVVPLAPAPHLAPASPDDISELKRRLDLPPTFFLFLGALEPRKNVVTLIKALARLRADGDDGARLVIAGAEGWRNAAVHEEVRALGLGEAVRFAGYVAPEDLPALFGAATAFVYPSLFEGFGLPPLEAMVCGAPVICSNVSSLPEVVGAAALLIDPLSTDDLAAALRRLLDDADLRARLRTAGLARAALFSWQRTARETLRVYHEALGERGRGA